MKKTMFRRVFSLITTAAMATSLFTLPAAPAFAAATEAFYDNFESYAIDTAIPKRSGSSSTEGIKWDLIDPFGKFTCVKDPANPDNKVGYLYNNGFVTVRTPAVNTASPLIFSGRIYNSGIPTDIGPGYALQFTRPGNTSFHSIKIAGSQVCYWVPDQWIDFTICIRTNAGDKKGHIYAYLSSEKGLSANSPLLNNTTYRPESELQYVPTIVFDKELDLAAENKQFMLNSNWGDAVKGYYLDDFKIQNSLAFDLSIPQKTNVENSVTVNFDQPVKKSLVTNMANLQLSKQDGTAVSIGSVQATGAEIWSKDGDSYIRSIQITPAQAFAPDTNYKVGLSRAVVDFAGNKSSNIVYFNTGSAPPPPDEAAAVDVQTLTLDPSEVTVPEDLVTGQGLTCALSPNIAPDNATIKTLSWSSSDDTTATVDQNGNVTPIKPGEVTITAVTTDETDISATCKITVTAKRSDNQKLNLSQEERPDINISQALQYPTDQETAKVALWKNNARGAFSITTDDPSIHTNCFDAWIKAKQDFGQNVTFFTWTNRTNLEDDNFKKLKAAGMDLQSHSKQHFSAVDQMNLTTGQVLEEYSYPARVIPAVSLAYPEGLHTELPYDSKAYASNYYIAARGVTGQVNMPNKTGITGQQQTTDYMHISSQSVNINSPTTMDTPFAQNWHLEGLVKSLCNDGSPEWSKYTYKNNANLGGWGVMHTHGIDATSTQNPSHPGETFTGEQLVREVMGFVKDTNGLVWGDSFTDVAKYAQERDSAVLSVTAKTSDEIKYTLTDQMDDAIFNYPLTVMVKIPSTWDSVTATQNGTEVTAVVKDGYALVDSIPDRGEISVKMAAPKDEALPENMIDASITKAFPGGKLKAVTGGFDDGFANYDNEKWLTDLFTANGIKATFHLPSGSLKEEDTEKYKELYKGFEVSTHTRNHDNFYAVSPKLFEEELQADLERLPSVSSNQLEGMAYPNGGSAGPELKALLARNGIKYGRTTWCTRTFNLPEDLYNWNPTVFQYNVDDLVTYANKFAALTPKEMSLFYIWGHSYQLNDSNKAKTQAAYEALGNKADTWYASNIEIADYLTAINQLVIAPDENKVVTAYNPSSLSVWISANGTPVEVPPGASKAIMVTQSGDASTLSFNDPCSADPNSQDIKFFARENGVGQAKGVPDPITGANDDGYARYAPAFTEDQVKGQVHSLTYKVPDTAYDITDFSLITYRNEGRAGVFHVYASPDNTSYSEVNYTTEKSPDKNSWYLWRYDLAGDNLPKGTKYLKVCFPTNFEVANNDTPNHALLMDVNMTFSKGADTTVLVEDASPAKVPALAASTPENNTFGAAYDQKVTLVFNKAMDPATVSTQTVTVDGGSIQSITALAGNKSYQLAFAQPLENNTAYTVSLSEGITDATGTALSPTAFTFTTKDIAAGEINDTMCDTRHMLQTHGDLMTTAGVGPDLEKDVHLYRLSPDSANDPSYLVYRAPYGEFQSFEILTYRNTGAVSAPFTIYASADGDTYTKVMDDTQGTQGTPDGKWYIPSTCASSVPAGTKYIKIEFPAPAENESAFHMATVSNAKFTYQKTAADAMVALQHPDLRGLDGDRKIVDGSVSIDSLTTGKATLGVEIRNFEKAVAGENAVVLFAVYNNDQLESSFLTDLTIPQYGESVFARQEITLQDTSNLANYTLKCFIWDSVSGLTPLGDIISID